MESGDLGAAGEQGEHGLINVDCLVVVQERIRQTVPGARLSIIPMDGGQVRLTALCGYAWATWGIAPVALQEHPERTADELVTRLVREIEREAKRGSRE